MSTGKFNPFETIENCSFRLRRALFGLTQGKDCTANIDLISNDIITTCEKAPDAALGAVHLLHGHAYTAIHPIHIAALSHALCQVSNLPIEETKAIVSASLICNIGMHDLQKDLHSQAGALSQEQKEQINAHPIKSKQILESCGMDDKTILTIVAQHHERANGKGYPNKLNANEIHRGAKILALADCYTAMVSPRNYQEQIISSSALKTLFLERGKEYDEKLALLLIKHMGVYPPGTFVELNNGEIAIVVRRTNNNMAPQVASVISNKQRPLSRPIQRTNGSEEFAIKGIVENKKIFCFSVASIWGYNTT